MAIVRAYLKPKNIEEAELLLAESGGRAVILAGGSRLVGELESRMRPEVDTVVDLALLGLNYLRISDGFLCIGAATSLTDVCEFEAARHLCDGLLVRAAWGEGPVNLRNAATVGGVVATAETDSEFYAALLALGATVRVAGSPVLTPLEGLGSLSGLLVEVQIPLRSGRCGIARVSRTPADRPIVAAIAVVGDGWQRVAFCGLSTRPQLDGAVVEPWSDFRGSAAYRQSIAPILRERALAEARATSSLSGTAAAGG
jgi:CO/xanthine dehydrogenase FAD-binding subunit